VHSYVLVNAKGLAPAPGKLDLRTSPATAPKALFNALNLGSRVHQKTSATRQGSSARAPEPLQHSAFPHEEGEKNSLDSPAETKEEGTKPSEIDPDQEQPENNSEFNIAAASKSPRVTMRTPREEADAQPRENNKGPESQHYRDPGHRLLHGIAISTDQRIPDRFQHRDILDKHHSSIQT
jgi:hypothetical protein